MSRQVPGAVFRLVTGSSLQVWVRTLMPTSPSKGNSYVKVEAESEVERTFDLGILDPGLGTH